MGIAILLHTLSAVVWVGGLFFALVCLRPAAAELEASARLKLWAGALQRFFRWVWLASALLLVSGLWMIFAVLGGMREIGPNVQIMMGTGILMMLLAGHTWFAPLRRLRLAVAESHWSDAGRRLNQVRLFLGIQLVLGLIVVAIASGGRYYLR